MGQVNPAYLAAVAKAGAKYNVPPKLLAAQIQAESNWNPNAKSSAGATGISQFMPGTAAGFGIDPHNPMQSIDAQGKMMHNLLVHFKGNVGLALAGYNAGEHAADSKGTSAAAPGYINNIMKFENNYPGLSNSTLNRAASYGKIVAGASKGAQTAAKASLGMDTGNTSPGGLDTSTMLMNYLSNASNPYHDSSNDTYLLTQIAQASDQAQAAGTTVSSTPVTSLTTTPDTGLTAPVGQGGYSALTSAKYVGNDQGVDFTGSGPIHALANGVVTRIDSNTGWPGAKGKGSGNIIVYKMTSGPHAGKFVYIAEAVNPIAGLKVGSTITKGQQVGSLNSSYPGIETGFAQDAHGTAYGTTSDGKKGNAAPYGSAFNQFIQQVSSSK